MENQKIVVTTDSREDLKKAEKMKRVMERKNKLDKKFKEKH